MHSATVHRLEQNLKIIFSTIVDNNSSDRYHSSWWAPSQHFLRTNKVSSRTRARSDWSVCKFQACDRNRKSRYSPHTSDAQYAYVRYSLLDLSYTLAATIYPAHSCYCQHYPSPMSTSLRDITNFAANGLAS